MKTLILALLAILIAVPAMAADVTLQWNAPPIPEWGTRLYIGTESENYIFSEDAGSGSVQFTISNLIPGKTYYIAAKHYLNGMESEDYSNEIEYIVPSELTILDNLPVINEDVKTYQITIRKIDQVNEAGR